MSIIILLAIIIIAEKITGKPTIELVTFILKKVWSIIEWIILFLLRMDEPRGGKS